MLDINFIRENPDLVKRAAKNKNVDVDIDRLIELDKQRRELLSQEESIREKRNQIAAKVKAGKPEPMLIEEGRNLKIQLAKLEGDLEPIKQQWLELMYMVPNIPEPEVPIGKTEDDNEVTEVVGRKPEFDFEPKNHWEIAQAKDWIDKDRASKVAGARFAYIKGSMVELQFALVGYVMSRLTDQQWLEHVIKKNDLKVTPKPFVPVLPPSVVKTEPFKGTGRLNKEEQTYKLEDEDLWLNASAEHSICPMYMNEIIDESDFPLRYVGYATSFRKEAGTYGKDMEGILRMHQFDKMEMEVFSTPSEGKEEHLFLIAIQREFLEEIGLPYQVLEKCTADIGTPNAKGVDLETWLPGQGRYRETSSADYMADFQARRLKIRVRDRKGEVHLAHTNDATAIVMSRIPPAIIENNQTEEGNVRVPEVLRPFMGGKIEI